MEYKFIKIPTGILLKNLNENILKVIFIKSDDTIRTMYATRNRKLIKDSNSIVCIDDVDMLNKGYIRVYDMQKNALRYINTNKLLYVEIYNNSIPCIQNNRTINEKLILDINSGKIIPKKDKREELAEKVLKRPKYTDAASELFKYCSDSADNETQFDVEREFDFN